MEMWKEEKQPDIWDAQDEANYTFMKAKYENRKALGEEAIAKRKALMDISSDNPFYHRATASAEMAQIRFDMAYIVAENTKLRGMIGTISWLHEQLSIVQGAYQYIKSLAERSRIDYATFETGMKLLVKIKGELTNGVTQRSDKSDGEKG